MVSAAAPQCVLMLWPQGCFFFSSLLFLTIPFYGIPTEWCDSSILVVSSPCHPLTSPPPVRVVCLSPLSLWAPEETAAATQPILSSAQKIIVDAVYFPRAIFIVLGFTTARNAAWNVYVASLSQ